MKMYKVTFTSQKNPVDVKIKFTSGLKGLSEIITKGTKYGVLSTTDIEEVTVDPENILIDISEANDITIFEVLMMIGHNSHMYNFSINEYCINPIKLLGDVKYIRKTGCEFIRIRHGVLTYYESKDGSLEFEPISATDYITLKS